MEAAIGYGWGSIDPPSNGREDQRIVSEAGDVLGRPRGRIDRERQEQLCAALAEDLEGSFEAMVLTYQDRLYSFALRITGSTRDAEEVAQDAFVRAYRALLGYESDRIRSLALSPWLYQITLNVARNRLRGVRLSMVPLEQDGEESGGALGVPDERARQPESVVEQAESRDLLSGLLAALPDRYRAAVVLRYIEELSYAEIAQLLNQPVGTSKANVHRGIMLLRSELAARSQPDHEVVEVFQ